jgi:hypothetical protein
MENHGDERLFLQMLLKNRLQFEVGKNIPVVEDEAIFILKEIF